MRRTKAEFGPDSLDIHIGSLLRQHRVLQGISQVALGKEVDMTFQQIQKYENGQNRISASMLWKLSQALKVPVGAFYTGLKMVVPQGSPVMDRDALEVVRAYQAITDDETRRSIKLLLRTVAKKTGRTA